MFVDIIKVFRAESPSQPYTLTYSQYVMTISNTGC